MIHFITLSIFPQIFESPLNYSIIKRAKDKNLIKFTHYDIRDFSTNKHKNVDDQIYGGGAGQLMTPQPIFDAIKYIKQEYGDIKTIFFTPKGRQLNTKLVKKFALAPQPPKGGELEGVKMTYLLLSGRYEGIDNRIREHLIDEEISIGDYILSGGEFASLIFIDAITRYIEGALGNEESLHDESFEDNLLEYPQYTRPANFRGMKVPDILLSGNHQKIKEWRYQESLKITNKVRKDLIAPQSPKGEVYRK